MKSAAVVVVGTILVPLLAHGAVPAPASDSGAPTSGVSGRPPEHSRSGVNLVALVGRRIELTHVEPKPDEIPFNAEYLVKVEVLQVVFGSYSKKEITFSSHVHVGPPAFEDSEFGLVYISEHEGRLVQQKYLFQALYPTADGRLAGCGDPYAEMADMHRHGVKAEAVTFSPPVDFPTRLVAKREVRRRYPKPFFRHQQGRAVCVMGNYPADLFQVMKEGYLTARGVFGSAAPQRPEPSNKALQQSGAPQ